MKPVHNQSLNIKGYLIILTAGIKTLTTSKSAIFEDLPVTSQNLYLHRFDYCSVTKKSCD
jgi:hypothetical protein